MTVFFSLLQTCKPHHPVPNLCLEVAQTEAGLASKWIFSYGILLPIRRNDAESKRLTMRKHAPKIIAFIFTSRSKGKRISKWSAFPIVDKKPFHFLMILPMLEVPSRVLTCNAKSGMLWWLKSVEGHASVLFLEAVCGRIIEKKPTNDIISNEES